MDVRKNIIHSVMAAPKPKLKNKGIPFLGEIPLDLNIRIASDGGVPMVVSKAIEPASQSVSRYCRFINRK
jgi:hypothetical protein